MQIVIVTGAAGDIGRVYAKALAEAGYGVVAADLNAAGEVAAEIEAAGGTALATKVDVSDRFSTEAMAAQALEHFGRIDGLVNNAAYYTAIVKKDFTELTDEEWDRCFAVNVRGAWLCARAVAPAMKRQRGGKIVNVSSMTVPTMRPSKAPANRAAPAPVPNSQKDSLRRRNSSVVRTSESVRIRRSRLRMISASVLGARRSRKYDALSGGVPT